MIGSRSVYGKAPTRQLHSNSIIIAVLGSGHTGEQFNSFDAVIHMQERFLLGCISPFMPSCDSPNTSQRFALGEGDVCLVGQNPTCSVPALQGCEGLRSYDHSIERHEYTPYSPPSFFPVESGPIRYIRSLYVHLAGRNNSKPSRPLQHPNPSRLLQYGRGSILNFALRRSWQD